MKLRSPKDMQARLKVPAGTVPDKTILTTPWDCDTEVPKLSCTADGTLGRVIAAVKGAAKFKLPVPS